MGGKEGFYLGFDDLYLRIEGVNDRLERLFHGRIPATLRPIALLRPSFF